MSVRVRVEQSGSARVRVQRLVETRRFQQVIMAVILINAATLGAEASPPLVDRYGAALHALDRVALAIFVAELVVKLYTYRLRYFRDPWNCFDFLVVAISLVPATGAFAVLRALRVLRVLRLISLIPSMRQVVGTLLASLPGVASIVGLLVLTTYVAAVMATKLFGDITPEHFGDLGTSLWTLFQVMTGESWPDVAGAVMTERPAAWIFFLVYILISTFVVLNLFLAVVVGAMESVRESEAREAADAATVADGVTGATDPVLLGSTSGTDPAVLAELAALREEVRALRELLTGGHAERT